MQKTFYILLIFILLFCISCSNKSCVVRTELDIKEFEVKIDLPEIIIPVRFLSKNAFNQLSKRFLKKNKELSRKYNLRIFQNNERIYEEIEYFLSIDPVCKTKIYYEFHNINDFKYCRENTTIIYNNQSKCIHTISRYDKINSDKIFEKYKNEMTELTDGEKQGLKVFQLADNRILVKYAEQGIIWIYGSTNTLTLLKTFDL